MTIVEDVEPGRLAASVAAGAAAAALGLAGCAHQQTKASGEEGAEEKSAEQKKIDKLEARIEELERTNGRLSVRVDEMEDELFLLQDRVQANRLSLQRRKNAKDDRRAGRSGTERGKYIDADGGSRGRPRKKKRRKGRARAPDPEPDTRYSGRNQGSGDHPVTRIPLSPEQSRSTGGAQSGDVERRGSTDAGSAGDERPGGTQQGGAAASDSSDGASSSGSEVPSTSDERRQGEPNKKVVITEKEFQKFARRVEQNDDGEARVGDSTARAGSSGGESPQKRVTDEQIETGTDADGSAGSGSDGETQGSDSGNTRSGASSSPKAPPPDVASADAAFEGKKGLDLYKAALGKYRSGEFAVALQGFQQFMDADPRRDYRDNGLYWIGECHFGMGDHERAIEFFQRVIDEYPEGNKVPDAMLKMALGYREIGMNDKARSVLEKLTQRYPTTNAGQLGEKKLSNFES